MRLLVEGVNAAVGVEGGRIVPPAGSFDVVLRVPDGELRPGLINPHDHLHRNHYGRLGRPPYPDAYAWGRDLHDREAAAVARGRAVPRRDALLTGAWKNLRAGVTTVVHHDPWEPDFDDDFPVRVARVRAAHSIEFERDPAAWLPGDGPFAVHLAEGVTGEAAEEVRELERRGLLDERLLAVHAVGVDADGVRRLRAAGAAVVWCPTSNLFLLGRTAPAELLAPGVDVLVGSDSLLSGAGTLLDELRCARSLGMLSDARLLAAVGDAAARRLGLPAPSLAPGAPADLVVLRRPPLEAAASDVAVVVAAGVLRVLDPTLAPALGPWAAAGRVVGEGGVARWVSGPLPNATGLPDRDVARAPSRRLRVVQVSFHADVHRRDAATLLRVWPTLGGVAAAAARAGVEVAVVQAAAADETVRADGVTFRFVDDGGEPVRALPGGVRVPRTPARVLAAVAALAPDVVHVHGLAYPYAVRRLTRALAGVPVVVQDHASRAPGGWRRLPARWGYRGVAAVVFTAREQADPFVAAGVLRPGLPVFEVLEGSTTFTPGDRSAARRLTGLHGDPCLLWTGHLDPNKDPLTTLAALERAVPRLPDPRLWCCFGKAPLLDAVRRRVDDSPALRGRVTLLGARSHADMEALFRAADFFVQTSHREGSGYSVVEALACGTPPLVTDIPSLRRVVGAAGSLTPVGDASALAEAIVAWAARDAAVRRAAARARFDAALSFDVIGRELRGVYEAVAAR
jgi:glycosyltransferase involved in cell wall biosynthesis/cytosine/adenosine deaminase-related metal-dependent hydrolase